MNKPPRPSKVTIDDPKFMALRKKLDGLSYHQTLHPDSCELVERLLNEHQKVYDKYSTLKNSQNKQAQTSNK